VIQVQIFDHLKNITYIVEALDGGTEQTLARYFQLWKPGHPLFFGAKESQENQQMGMPGTHLLGPVKDSLLGQIEKKPGLASSHPMPWLILWVSWLLLPPKKRWVSWLLSWLHLLVLPLKKGGCPGFLRW